MTHSPNCAAQKGLRCDCRAMTCRHQFQDSKHCLHCGISVDTLREQQRAELLAFALADTHTSEVGFLNDLMLVFLAVSAGAQFELTGPGSFVPGGEGLVFSASLESFGAQRFARGHGPSLTDALAELAREWQRQLPHSSPSSHEESPTVVDGEPQGEPFHDATDRRLLGAVDWKLQGHER